MAKRDYQKSKNIYDLSHKKYMEDKKTISLVFTKEEKEKIDKYCKDNNVSISTFIKSRLKDIIEH